MTRRPTESNDPVAAYIAALSGVRRDRGEALDALVRQLFPAAERDLGYRMPTYRLGGEFFAWASQKKYLSVYTCSPLRIAEFCDKYPKISRGAGCLNFRDADPFPLADIADVVRNAFRPGTALARTESSGNDRGPSPKKGERRGRQGNRRTR